MCCLLPAFKSADLRDAENKTQAPNLHGCKNSDAKGRRGVHNFSA